MANQHLEKENMGRKNQAIRKNGVIAQNNALADLKFNEYKKAEGVEV
jgi:hypothetical protein